MSHSEQVQVRSLCVGQPLMTDLTDSSGVLLLRAGVVITQGFIDTLTRRGISTVSTCESDEIRAAREEAEAAAAKNAEKTKPSKSPAVSNRPAPSAASSTPALDAVQPDGSFATDLSYDPGRAPAKKLSVAELHALSAQTERAFDQALDQYAGLGPALADAQVTDLGLASDLLRGFQRYVGADPALVHIALDLHKHE
ncbi:MAG: hypothetical protein AAF593_10405, partial [Planctomycetota bacterium]